MTHRPLSNPSDFNEAEVDANVVRPYLSALGVTIDQIRAQRTFSIQVGSRNVRIGGRERVSGRLDYLVERTDGTPLFVVEIKSPGHALTDSDRDQGISYARLTHPITPVVLLTNGAESRLFDAITREELTGTTIDAAQRRAAVVGANEVLQLRFEALRHFIGYSPENLSRVSHAQLEARMRGLRSTDRDASKKYLPDAYVSRAHVRRRISEFLGTSKTTFALLGASGVGKTNEMCALAEELGKQHLVLFFNAAEIGPSVAEAVADEFNWRLSEALPTAQVCRRLSELVRGLSCPAVVIVDAVDEAESAEFPALLSDFAARLEDFAGSIRLIISSKPQEWPRFASFRGVERSIVHGLYRPPVTDDGELGMPHSCILRRFDAAESERAIAAYTPMFGLPDVTDPGWTRAMREAVTDPFMLRVIAEVTTQRGCLPSDPSEPAIVEAYVAAKLNRTADPQRARLELAAVAEALMSEGSDSERGTDGAIRNSVNESVVRTVLRQPANAHIADELVAFGLLARAIDSRGLVRLAFSYDRVRDYVIAFSTMRLHQLEAVAFRAAVRSAFESPVGRSAIRWYLPSATANQWREGFIPVVHERLSRVLHTYIAFRGLLAPAIAVKLPPHFGGELGIVFSAQQRNMMFGFGVFRRRDSDVPMTVEDPEHFVFGRRDPAEVRSTISVWDVGELRMRQGFWYLEDPERFAADYALTELRKLASAGQLEDSADSHLLAERILALTMSYQRELGYDQAPGIASEADLHLCRHLIPLDFASLDRRVQVLLGAQRLLDEHSDRERERLLAEAIRSGQPIPRILTINFGHELLRQFRASATAAVARGERFDATAREGDLLALAKAVTLGLASGESIPEPLLPAPDVALQSYARPFEIAYSDDQLARFLRVILSRALAGRVSVAAQSFHPVLAAAIPRKQWSTDADHRLVVLFQRRESGDPHYRFGGVITVAVAERSIRETAPTPTIEVLIQPHSNVNPVRYEEGSHSTPSSLVLDSPGGPVRICGYHTFGFSHLFFPPTSRPYSPGGHTNDSHFSPLRTLVYDLVSEDLKAMTTDEVLDALASAQRWPREASPRA